MGLEARFEIVTCFVFVWFDRHSNPRTPMIQCYHLSSLQPTFRADQLITLPFFGSFGCFCLFFLLWLFFCCVSLFCCHTLKFPPGCVPPVREVKCKNCTSLALSNPKCSPPPQLMMSHPSSQIQNVSCTNQTKQSVSHSATMQRKRMQCNGVTKLAELLACASAVYF